MVVSIPAKEQLRADLVPWRAQSEQRSRHPQYHQVTRLAEDADEVADLEAREAQDDATAEG